MTIQAYYTWRLASTAGMRLAVRKTAPTSCYPPSPPEAVAP